MQRVNIGCGLTPTKGWLNFDNSWSLLLGRMPLITDLLSKCGLLVEEQKEFIEFARKHDIRFADAARKIGLADNSCSAVYSSHMLEHLDCDEAESFVKEAKRILAPRGVLRLAVPDFKHYVDDYLSCRDPNRFMTITLLGRKRLRTIREKVRYLLCGDRQHLWMYDGPSLVRLVESAGFAEAEIMPAGSTKISHAGELDLYERADSSVYVEATKA